MQEIQLACGTVYTLQQLEDAGHSYVPCGRVDGTDKPLLAFAQLWKDRKQITRATYGKRWNAHALRHMNGVQLMTGKPTYRYTDRTGIYLYYTSLDIERRMIEEYPAEVEQIDRLYRENVIGSPCRIQTKSNGLRLDAYTEYVGKKMSFTDDGGMLFEVLADKCLARIDNRYRMLEGSLLELPTLPKETLQEIYHIAASVATVEQSDEKPREVVETSQLGDLDIEWGRDGRSQLFPTQHCQRTSHRSNRDEVRFTKHADGSVDGKCFNCGESWWEVKMTASEPGGSDNLSVEIEGQLRNQVRKSFENLANSNDPSDFFVNSAGLWSRVLPGDSKISGVKGDAFRLMLAEKMNFYRFNRNGDLVDAAVPRDVAIGVEFHRERLQRFPRLDRVIDHPILLESGEILDRRGYVSEIKSWILSDMDLQLTDSIDEARKILIEPFEHFIFVSDRDRANAFAYLFTLLLRERFDLAPFFAVVSHKGGTGKGKLINSLHRIAEGRNLEASTLDRNRWDEAEIRRQIMAELLQGRASILIDNLPDGYTLKSSALEALATSEFFGGKVIYRAERPTFRTWPVWVFTGNNVQFGGMLPRRIQKIAITTDVEDPHLRELPDLDAYVKQHRDTLLGAAFSLIIAWQEAGAPRADVHIGNFQEWGQIIGGLLGFAGVEGFDPTLTEKSDEDLANREFVFDLYSEFVGEAFSARDVLNRVIDPETNQGSLSLEGVIDPGVKNMSQSLGYLLKRLRGQVFTDRETGTTIKLEKVEGSSRPVKYTFSSPMQHTDEIDEIPF